MRHWLGAGIVLYALLVIAALGDALTARPSFALVGFHDEEIDADSGQPFRWTTGEVARLRTPVAAPGLVVPVRVSRPDGAYPREVSLRVNGPPVAEALFMENGSAQMEVFLPPVLGEETWARVEGAWERLLDAPPRSPLAVALGDRWRAGLGSSPRDPQILGLLWRRATRPGWPLSAGHAEVDLPFVELEIRVDGSFIPAELEPGNRDPRRLGVAVGQARWLRDAAVDGFGMYEWEDDASGRFRWTGRTASQRITVSDRILAMPLKASHPDIAEIPVSVTLYWNARELRTVVLSTNEWQIVHLGPELGPAGSPGVLSLLVDRTWSPATSAPGESADTRILGVAVGSLRWRAEPGPEPLAPQEPPRSERAP